MDGIAFFCRDNSRGRRDQFDPAYLGRLIIRVGRKLFYGIMRQEYEFGVFGKMVPREFGSRREPVIVVKVLVKRQELAVLILSAAARRPRGINEVIFAV